MFFGPLFLQVFDSFKNLVLHFFYLQASVVVCFFSPGTVDLLNRGETFKSVIDTIKLVGPGNNMSKPRKGSDHGDHPPITPTRSASPAQVRSS